MRSSMLPAWATAFSHWACVLVRSISPNIRPISWAIRFIDSANCGLAAACCWISIAFLIESSCRSSIFFTVAVFFSADADELILSLVADLLRVPGVLDEVFGEFFLLADRFLDRAQALADLHLPLDAAFVFALNKPMNSLECQIAMTNNASHQEQRL